MRKNSEELTQWVDTTIGDDSWRSVAEKLKTTHSTIKRRLDNGEADAIVELASAYNVNPIPGLISTGAISKADVLAFAGTFAVEDLDDVELAQIMVDRLKAHEQSPNRLRAVPDPMSDVSDIHDGTVTEWDETIPHAADSSIDEDAEREKRGEDLID